jgi:hypothetical protein
LETRRGYASDRKSAKWPRFLKGEDIARIQAQELRLPDHDFWLFDSKVVARFSFDDEDTTLGVYVTKDPAEVLAACQARDARRSRHAGGRESAEASAREECVACRYRGPLSMRVSPVASCPTPGLTTVRQGGRAAGSVLAIADWASVPHMAAPMSAAGDIGLASEMSTKWIY